MDLIQESERLEALDCATAFSPIEIDAACSPNLFVSSSLFSDDDEAEAEEEDPMMNVLDELAEDSDGGGADCSNSELSMSSSPSVDVSPEAFRLSSVRFSAASLFALAITDASGWRLVRLARRLRDLDLDLDDDLLPE